MDWCQGKEHEQKPGVFICVHMCLCFFRANNALGQMIKSANLMIYQNVTEWWIVNHVEHIHIIYLWYKCLYSEWWLIVEFHLNTSVFPGWSRITASPCFGFWWSYIQFAMEVTRWIINKLVVFIHSCHRPINVLWIARMLVWSGLVWWHPDS